MATGHKVRFPTTIGMLALLYQKFPTVMHPMVAGD